MRTKNASAEIEAIEERALADQGIIRVVDEPPEVVQAVSQALRNETPLGGKDSDWVVIGGLPIGGLATIRGTDGTPLFRFQLEAIKGVHLDNDPNANYVVMLKRTVDGGVERLSVDFSRTLEYSTLDENISKEKSVALAARFGWVKK